jgi:carbon starvation protein
MSTPIIPLSWPQRLLWLGIAITGAAAAGGIALNRGESINAIWFIVAAVCTYLIGYRFYSAWIAARVLMLDETRATPAERLADGRDYVPTNRWVVFGHHFAAIAGPGPLIGPTLAAQFGYLPGTLWILVGSVLAGCVQGDA